MSVSYKKYVRKCKIWFSQLYFFFELLLFRLVIVKKIPQHVAIIMDGNRRYAREAHIPVGMGHLEGFRSMQRVLRWNFLLGVPEVTIYAFSIDNFKRPDTEVRLLEALGRNAIKHVKRYEEYYRSADIRFRMIGRLDMLADDIRAPLAFAQEQTKNCTSFKINFAVAYTGQDDITNGIQTICRSVQNEEIHSDRINEEELEKNLRTNECSKPDVFIRTSGETRLSNFLLWEVSNCMLFFPLEKWPNFSLWDFIKIIIQYQRHNEKLPEKSGVIVNSNNKVALLKKAREYLEQYENLKNKYFLLDNFQNLER